MQKWICINLIRICFSVLWCSGANIAFAETQCSLTGEWYQFPNAMIVELEQKGTQVTTLHPLFIPDCGARILEGSNENNHFHLKWHYPNPKPNTTNPACKYWSEFEGTFANNDCLRISGAMTDYVVDEDSTFHYTQPFSWWRNQFWIISPDPSQELIISAEPKMPSFEAIAKMVTGERLNLIKSLNGGRFPYKWKIKIDNLPCYWRFETELDEVSTELPSFKPDFNLLKFNNNLIDGGIFGGNLTLSVSYNDTFSDSKTYTIKGTNPGKLRIEALLYHQILRGIACQESKYKQFYAEREGGIGDPWVGGSEKNGGVGIMQLCLPKPKVHEIWNWRKNIEGGIALYKIKYKMAEKFPSEMLDDINRQRTALKLPLCKNLPSLTEDQLLREATRRYNGGTEHQFQPIDDPECKGKWIVKPIPCRKCDKNYVEKVLNCPLD